MEPRWRSRQDLERRLTALGTIPQLDEQCLPKLDELKTRLQTRRNRHEKVTERRRQIVADVRKLAINDVLCRQAPRLEALSEQQHWMTALEAQILQLETELETLESKHAAHSKVPTPAEHKHKHEKRPAAPPDAAVGSRTAEPRSLKKPQSTRGQSIVRLIRWTRPWSIGRASSRWKP